MKKFSWSANAIKNYRVNFNKSKRTKKKLCDKEERER